VSQPKGFPWQRSAAIRIGANLTCRPRPSFRPLFEEVVRKPRLSPADYEGSLTLKEWVRKNKDQKYIPDDLLKRWGFEVKGDL